MTSSFIKVPFLFIFAALCCSHVQGQDVYLSISGQNVQFLSGDDRHQYDIWIKPEAEADSSILQVYDAGLGGAVDLITSRSNTQTTYRVFPFENGFNINGENIEETEASGDPITTLITQNEERYKNRWVNLHELSPHSENGYLIRVTTSEGADVNNFNLRVVDQNGTSVDRSQWQIITFDLSIGFYRSTPNDFFQLRPYQQTDLNVDLTAAGEEDSEIQKMDAFGDTYPLQDSVIPEDKLGLQNSWGLNMSGSNEVINNFTIFGSEKPVLWVYDPVSVSQPTKPFAAINENVTNSCSEFAIELRSNAFQSEALKNTLWILDDAEIATGQQPFINFEERGALTINALVPNQMSYFPKYWDYGKEIFVNTPPVAELTVPKTILSPSEQITLSAENSYDPEGQPLSYTWYVNGTQRGTDSTFQFSNTISGSSLITLRVSDGGASQQCSITEEQTRIRVNTKPYAEIDLVPLFGTDESVTFNAVNPNDADNDPLYFSWESSGIAENSLGQSISINHSTPGVYNVSLTVNDSTNATNSTYTTTRQYEVNAAAEVAFTSPEKVAPGNEFTLNASETSDPNDSTLSYLWLIDDEQIGEGENFTHILNEPGIFDIQLVVDDGRNVSNSVQQQTRSIRVNEAPQPMIDAPEHTSTSLVTFNAQTFDEIKEYNWDFGDGNSASGSEVQHRYQDPGTYTVTLTVDDAEGLSNSIQSSEQQLVINKFPEARFTSPVVVAPGENFTPDGTLSIDEDGMVDSYEWYINGIPAGTGEQPTLRIAQPGEQSISLQVQDNSGFDIAQGYTSKTIRVNKAPVPKWETIPAEPVPAEEVTFSAANSYDPDGDIVSYRWEFEDGTVLEGQQISRTFDESGTKNFTLTVLDNDRLSNSEVTIEASTTLNHQPYIVTEPSILSNSLSINLNASGSYDLDEDPLSYEWTLPDGSKRNESSFSWTAPEPGVHIISLTVNDGKGLANSQNEELIQVLINRPAKAVVDSLLQSCTGQTVLFNSSRSYDPDGDAFQVNWDFGDGVTSDQANPSYSYDEPGVYQAKLTLNDRITEKETEAIIPVIVEGSPIARMNIADTTICVNSALDFDGTASSDPSGSLPSFAWDLGDGNSETGSKVRHVFTEPGEYMVSLTVEGSGSGMCPNISQTTAKVRVIEGPEANFELPSWSAPGENITLDGTESVANGGFRNVEWLIENEDTTYVETGLETSHTFTEPGEYFVTLNLETNTSTSCNTVSLTKSIKVNAEPEINWELPDRIAAGTDLKLDASKSTDRDGFITNYQWFMNDSLISTNATEIIKAMEAGTHTLRLQIQDNADATNNTVQTEKTIFVNSAPKPTINLSEIKYVGQNVTVSSAHENDNDRDELTTNWFIDGEAVEEPSFTPTENRIYRITLIQNDGRELPNSIDSAVVNYVPKKLPVADPEIPQSLVRGGALTIADLKLGDGWSFLTDGNYADTWTAKQTPSDTLNVAWRLEGQKLTEQSFSVKVMEPLTIESTPEAINMEWNPANPLAIVEAPAVNRDPANVQYIWKQNNDVIGQGIRQEVSLNEGENRFIIEVKDLNVEQSEPIETELLVITE